VALLKRDAAGIIAEVDDGVTEMLGWRPEQLIGLPSTTLIHPDDQPSAIAAWMQMLVEPGAVGVWQGRYRAADGSWQWVETVNENRLRDSEPAVHTTLSLVALEQVSIHEELRSRKQLLNRLVDALPVGVFQLDLHGGINFSNDRLGAILEGAVITSLDELRVLTAPVDRPLLEGAIGAVFAEQPVDDVELRFTTRPPRVCQLGLRPLTDSDGFVTGAVGCLSDVTEQVALRRQLERRASVDPLTDCLNRSATLRRIEEMITRTTRANDGTAIIYIDLDDFKSVNDRYGHATGDRVLVRVAEIIRASVRSYDAVGRLGGDEFVVVCPRVTSAKQAVEIAQRISVRLNGAVDVGGVVVAIGASIGVAWADEAISADALVARADAGMYAVKRGRSETGQLHGRVAVA
jgi:diguanylate cyclase (GGDEF)-like protein/PAS domain S-box-containing protein